MNAPMPVLGNDQASGHQIPTVDNPIRRRTFLGGGLAVAGASLVACSTANSDDPAIAPKDGNLPVYVPLSGLKPDLPGTAEGVLPGYFHYPANPIRLNSDPVGDGSVVTTLLSGQQIATPKPRNKWWQALNSSMNVDLEVTQVGSADYLSKFQVMAAGGDFPDMVQIAGAPRLPDLLSKYFVDLSDYLGGDAVKKYPALAALPTSAWTNATVNGHLFGISQPRSLANVALTIRQDILDSLGIGEPSLSNGDDYLSLCKEVTDAKSNRWAFGAQPVSWILPAILEMMGAPNVWDVKGGKFTSAYESNLYPEALETVRKMWASGVIHPDSFGQPGANQSWWLGGTTVMYYQGFDWWPGFQRQYPEKRIGGIIHPKWNGGGDAPKHLGKGAYPNFIVIKKADKARVEMLLRVWNYLAAPFGTSEYLEVNYGVENHDYKLQGSDPVQAEAGVSEFIQGLIYVGSPQFAALYVPGNKSVVTAAHEYLKRTIPTGVPDHRVGLYSDTERTKGTPEIVKLNNLQADIVQGRKPVSDFVGAVAKWKTTVGDAIAAEYEQAFDKANS